MTTETNPNTAPKEIDTAALDQIVGAGDEMPGDRKQEQSDKLMAEQRRK